MKLSVTIKNSDTKEKKILQSDKVNIIEKLQVLTKENEFEGDVMKYDNLNRNVQII